MSGTVKKRRYDNRLRQQRADATRASVLHAARRLFTERGYAATSVQDIAREAGVSVDTLYTSVGRKPELLLAVHDMLLAETDRPVEASERAYVQQMRAAPGAVEKITIYSEALRRVLPQTAPLVESLRVAAQTDEACAKVYDSLAERRARNMRLLVADLRSTQQMRADVTDDEAATLIWSMNAPEYFTLLAARGLSAEQYAQLVRSVWIHTLLETSAWGDS